MNGSPCLERAGLRLLLVLLLVPALFALRPTDAEAQTRADSAAVLLATAMRIGNEGRAEVAEALYDFILQRYGDTAAAERVRTLRAQSPAMGRSGRAELQVWGTLYGAWLGVAVPLIAGADDPEPFGVGLLLGAPAGFFASRAYARSRPLSDGQARAITLGGTWGTWQGFGWASVLDLGTETVRECPLGPDDCFDYETGDDTEEKVAAAVAGGLAGIVTGALISRKPISAGLATTVNFGALWGTWIGVATGVITEGDDGTSDDHVLIGSLLGGNAGLVTTAILAPRWQLSRNRARLISLSGLIGGIAGLGIDLLAQPEDDEAVFAIPLVTSLAGLAIGAYTTRGYDAGGGGGDGAAGEALLDVRDGRWSLDLPPVTPALRRDPRTGDRALGARVRLFSARF